MDKGIDSRIAVIGMAGRFPGARDVRGFWQNIRGGVESVSFFSEAELVSAGVSRTDVSHSQYVKAAATIEGSTSFDASYFGYSQQEAELIDPQQRLFLEHALLALESAGCDPHRFSGAIGVFGGAATNLYQFGLWNKYLGQLKRSPAFTMAMIQGNDTDFLTSRASYKLGLRGPSVAIQAACSTSLVAVHLACQSLISGESDIALAGGVSVIYSLRKSGYFYEDGGAVSPDGHCRPFDARARGTIFGDGVGIVVLKTLTRAIADGDVIHAVILGSAVNNDGAGKVGYSAPSVDGQAAAIAEALAVADVDAGSIGYIEAHGTGTELGDPIEVEALTRAFRGATDKVSYCALGSVKGNVGHLNIAAGVTGLIKAVLAVREGIIPATINFQRPNPAIRLGESPFFVNAKTMAWPEAMRPCRAGVSSFGIGGSNAHVVLEGPPTRAVPSSRRAYHILGFSARTPEALARTASRIAADVQDAPNGQLAAVAYTLASGRGLRDCRQAMVLGERGEGPAEPSLPRIISGKRAHGAVAFLFPPATGGRRMGRGLYRNEPSFRTEIDRCESILRHEVVGADAGKNESVLWTLRHGEDAGVGEDRVGLYATAFAVAIGIARLWMQWGVEPSAVVGHGIGTVAAGYVAGVFGLADALRLVVRLGHMPRQDQQPARILESFSGIALGVPTIPIMSASRGQLMRAEDAQNPKVWAEECAAEDRCRDSIGRLREGAYGTLLEVGAGTHWTRLVPTEVESGLLGLASLAVPDGSDREAISFLESVSNVWVAGGPVRLELPYEGERPLKVEIASAPFEGKECGAAIVERIAAEHCIEASQAVLMPAPMRLGEYGMIGRVRQIWEDLFGAEAVTDESDFFACGGDSLAAVRVCRELSDAIGIDVPIRSIAEAPTVAQLASHLEELLVSEGRALLVDANERRQPRTAMEESAPDEILIAKRMWAECQSEERGGLVPEVHWIVLSEGFGNLRASLEDAFPGVRCRILSAANGNLARSYETAAADLLATLRLAIRERSGRRVLVQLVLPADREGWNYSGLAGLLKTSELEGGNLFGQIIGIEREAETTDVIRILRDEALCPLSQEVRYSAGQRMVAEWSEVEDEEIRTGPVPWRDGGTYLITGGGGGLGLIFARELISQTKGATVILTGRSDLSLPKQRSIQKIENGGSKVLYRRMDVAQGDAVDAVMSEIEMEFGGLNGIIHSAGVIKDSFILNKTRDELAAVFAPKVAGVINLDEATRNHPLDFMILFASGSGALGNVGQADYAAANSFLDVYAGYRNDLVARGIRLGRTVAIDWPLWRDGGMKVDESIVREHRSRGIASLTAAPGVQAFYRAIAAESEQVLIAYGDVERLRRAHDDAGSRRRERWFE